VRYTLDGNGDVCGHVRLCVLPVVDLKSQVVLAVVRAGFHVDHPRVLVELELCMLEPFPVELLVRQIPVVQIVHVHPTYLGIRRLSLEYVISLSFSKREREREREREKEREEIE